MSNDKNNLVYREQLDDNVIEMLSEDIGSNYSLRTENTKTIVAALNEILGKDIICNAVGSPLLTTDTFAQMGEKIHAMVNDFKAKLLGLGVAISGSDKLEALIEKMDAIDLGVDVEELLGPLTESLSGILEEHGVELTGEETLNELIVKVDVVLTEKNENESNIKNKLCNIIKDNGFEYDNDQSISDLIEFIGNKRIENNNYKLCDAYHASNGNRKTLILKSNGDLYGCGINSNGELGLGDRLGRSAFFKINHNVSSVSYNDDCVYIIKNDGSLWACGSNSYGQLGLGDATNQNNTFNQVTTNINNDVKEVVCGYRCAFTIKNDGSLWATGYGQFYKLGLGDNDNRTTFTQVTTNINYDVKQVACIKNYTFILKNDGSLWSCGGGSSMKYFTQISIDDSITIKKIIGTGDILYIITNEDDLYSYSNSEGMIQKNIGNVKHVVYGGFEQANSTYKSLFVLKNDGTLWSCGWNKYGQLGLGDTTDKNTLTQVTININNDVEQVYTNGICSFIIKSDGSLWSCGKLDDYSRGMGISDEDANCTTVFTRMQDF